MLPVDNFVAKNTSLRHKTLDAAEVVDGDGVFMGLKSLPHLENIGISRQKEWFLPDHLNPIVVGKSILFVLSRVQESLWHQPTIFL